MELKEYVFIIVTRCGDYTQPVKAKTLDEGYRKALKMYNKKLKNNKSFEGCEPIDIKIKIKIKNNYSW